VLETPRYIIITKNYKDRWHMMKYRNIVEYVGFASLVFSQFIAELFVSASLDMRLSRKAVGEWCHMVPLGHHTNKLCQLQSLLCFSIRLMKVSNSGLYNFCDLYISLRWFTCHVFRCIDHLWPKAVKILRQLWLWSLRSAVPIVPGRSPSFCGKL
jgi:hypothetical protein